MNKKRWFWASVGALVTIVVLDYVFNFAFLKDLYTATATLWRPEAELMKNLPYMYAGYVITAFIFAYIYAKGYEGKPSRAGEGLRFGLVIGLFISAPMALACFTTMPIPVALALGWFLGGLAEFLIAGLVVGLIYKKA